MAGRASKGAPARRPKSWSIAAPATAAGAPPKISGRDLLSWATGAEARQGTDPLREQEAMRFVGDHERRGNVRKAAHPNQRLLKSRTFAHELQELFGH